MMIGDFMKKYLFNFILISTLAFLIPLGVFAKEYSVHEFTYNGDSDKLVLYDDTIVPDNFFHVSLKSIKYKNNDYIINRVVGSSGGISETIKFNYDFYSASLIDLKNSGRCIEKISTDESVGSSEICPGATEYNEFLDFIFDKNNKPNGYFIYEPYSMIGGDLSFSLVYPEEVKKMISLNLAYLNVFNASKASIEANPVSYVKEDGTVVLKDLERDGYKFEGWYLDKNYQYRVTELTQELAEDYFSDSGHFTDIEKTPAEEVDGELVGKIDLYAKWSSNNVIANPKTLSTIGIIAFVFSFVGVGCLVIFVNKNRENEV